MVAEAGARGPVSVGIPQGPRAEEARSGPCGSPPPGHPSSVQWLEEENWSVSDFHNGQATLIRDFGLDASAVHCCGAASPKSRSGGAGASTEARDHRSHASLTLSSLGQEL